MKTKRMTELDVDFIGGTGPLTQEEEKRISEFIATRKMKTKPVSKKGQRKGSAPKRVRV